MYNLGGVFGDLVGRAQRGQPASDECFRAAEDDLQGFDFETDGEHLATVGDLVKSNWSRYQCVSDALVARTTLYGNEAPVIVRAQAHENIAELFRIYLERRQPGQPPQQWQSGTTEQYPAGPWMEDYQDWWTRDGRVAMADLEWPEAPRVGGA
jgi:hypothetical protein